jgi:hypothetical protein
MLLHRLPRRRARASSDTCAASHGDGPWGGNFARFLTLALCEPVTVMQTKKAGVCRPACQIVQASSRRPLGMGGDTAGPVRFAEIWLMLMFILKCCERKTRFVHLPSLSSAVAGLPRAPVCISLCRRLLFFLNLNRLSRPYI